MDFAELFVELAGAILCVACQGRICLRGAIEVQLRAARVEAARLAPAGRHQQLRLANRIRRTHGQQ